jgi:hypothetical protein
MHDVLGVVPDETAVPMRELGHAAAESDTPGPSHVPQWFY